MKRMFILMAFVVAVCCAQAQSVNQPGEKYPVYCSLKGYNFWGVGKVKVQLDLGYKTSNFETLLDENGKQIKFNTMMEVINYMAKRGWELDQVCFFTEGMSKTNVANYIMKKYINDDQQIREGLNTQAEKD
jgi:hypothetical protein